MADWAKFSDASNGGDERQDGGINGDNDEDEKQVTLAALLSDGLGYENNLANTDESCLRILDYSQSDVEPGSKIRNDTRRELQQQLKLEQQNQLANDVNESEAGCRLRNLINCSDNLLLECGVKPRSQTIIVNGDSDKLLLNENRNGKQDQHVQFSKDHKLQLHRNDRASPASSMSSSSDSSSSSSSLEDSDGVEQPRPPDGGWGWVVVAASFMVNLIADGITFSFGVLYPEFVTAFGGSKSETSWIGSLFMAMPLLSGPIASFLTDRYGCRRVTIAGSILATAGFVLSYFANSMGVVILTFGVLAGFGLSLCFVAAVVIVAYYFDKRRSFATGLSVCGSGIGTFVFPPIIQYLLNEYGWRGTTLILAGMFLNLAVCGCLMRDLEWTQKLHKSHKRKNKGRRSRWRQNSSSAESFSASSSANTTNNQDSITAANGKSAAASLVTATNAVLVEGLVNAAQIEDAHRSRNDKQFSSLVSLPTFVRNGEKVPLEVLELLSARKNVYNVLVQNYPSLLISSRSFSDSGGLNEMQIGSPNDEVAVVTSTPTGFLRSALVQPNAPMIDFDLIDNTVVATEDETLMANANQDQNCQQQDRQGSEQRQQEHQWWIQQRNPKAHHSCPEARLQHQRRSSVQCSDQPGAIMSGRIPTAYLKDIRMHRHSLTYRGAMLNINRYRLRASSCPDIYRNSMTTIAKEKMTWHSGLWEFWNLLVDMLDLSHFSDTRFLLFSVSNFLLHTWYDVPYVYLTDNAVELGFSQTQGSFLISIVGICNMAGEILLGWAGDKAWLNPSVVYAVCMALCGAFIALIPVTQTCYPLLSSIAGGFGFFIAANYSLTSIILVEAITLERFTNAYGLLLLVQGIANLMGPPLAGWLRDTTGSYNLSFYFSGGFIGLSGVMLMVMPLIDLFFRRGKSRRGQQQQQQQQNTRSQPDFSEINSV